MEFDHDNAVFLKLLTQENVLARTFGWLTVNVFIYILMKSPLSNDEWAKICNIGKGMSRDDFMAVFLLKFWLTLKPYDFFALPFRK